MLILRVWWKSCLDGLVQALNFLDHCVVTWNELIYLANQSLSVVFAELILFPSSIPWMLSKHLVKVLPRLFYPLGKSLR